MHKALLPVCMKYTVRGESWLANIAGGEAECYIYQETLTKSCILPYKPSGSSLSVLLYCMLKDVLTEDTTLKFNTFYWINKLSLKQVISHCTRRIALLLTLVLGFALDFALDSCNNNDILHVVGYNYNFKHYRQCQFVWNMQFKVRVEWQI